MATKHFLPAKLSFIKEVKINTVPDKLKEFIKTRPDLQELKGVLEVEIKEH